MATTAQEVFAITMALADEVSDNGTLNPTDVITYQVRTPGILTLLEAELTSIDVVPTAVTSLSNTLTVDDKTAKTLLPYALGMELFKEENVDIFNHFRNRYDALMAKRINVSTESNMTDYYTSTFESW